jgi:general secretion pathway protein D
VNTKSVRVSGLLLVIVGLLSACSSYRYTRRATDAMKADNWDAAVYFYMEALAQDPGNAKLKMELQRVRLKAAQEHFQRGMHFKDAGELRRAQAELELAVQLDPTQQYAEMELQKVRKDVAVLSQEGGAAKLAEMKKAASEMKVKPPMLNPASDEPMSLSFPNQTNVRDIYKAIGQAFGINILFDPKLKETKISIELKNVTARQALEAVMQAAGHFYKVLDEKTVIVVEDSPQNRRDYEDLVVKTFFLSNADVKDINNMLRALIDARRIAINEQLNSVVIRDTADKVAIAERLINANDKAKAEVLVDVELIQVDSTKLREVGTSLSSYTYNLALDTTQLGANTTTGAVPITSIPNITRSMWATVLPSVTINLIKSAGEAETLAQPQLRITEGQKGNLIIGDKVPIPTTTFNTTQTIGGNIVPITAFQYQDVGIKIDIEPRVHHNNEITLKLKVEASQLGDYITVGPGQTQPKITTRNFDSVIRLKDGETSLLAGLFKYNKSESKSGIPWLSDLPVIGSLFGDTSSQYTKTDLVLTLTPHIIRNPDITEEDLAPLWVGTENRVTIFGNSPRVRSAVTAGPLGNDSGVPGIGVGGGPPPPAPDESTNPQDVEERRPRVTVPRPPVQPTPPSPGQAVQPQGQAGSASAESVTAQPSADTSGLTTLTFYPSRLPVAVGKEGELAVVLDPGAGGVSPPLHLAYDPTRLEVTQVEAGSVHGTGGPVQAQVTHTPALGWITVSWNEKAVASATLLRLKVRPRLAGEIQVIFAGPIGAVVSRGATVVALPTAAAEATQ